MNELRTTRKIEFADTDMEGIVHFARFLVFMETAEHEFLRALGAEVHMTVEKQDIGWPRTIMIATRGIRAIAQLTR